MQFQLVGSMRRNLIALSIFAAIYLGFGILLAANQERFIYFPLPQDFADCPEFQSAEKVEYEGTRMYFKNNGTRAAVLYHGNAGSACDRFYIASLFNDAKISYVVPEYTGYSNDDIRPSHDAIKKDVEHVVEFLGMKNFTDVIVVGESIGTGVASYHASLQPPAKLLLITPFTSLLDIAQDIYWFYPVKFLVKNAFDNARLLAQYDGEILILHGDKDEIIPLEMAETLFASLHAENKEMAVINGAGHNTLFAFSEVYTAISYFLK